MRFQKRKRNKILPDDFVQFFSRAKSGPVKGEKVEKHWSLQDFKAIHQKVIDDIKNTTKYLKNDDVKDKVRDKIIKTNYIIKTHWKYISDKETRMRLVVKVNEKGKVFIDFHERLSHNFRKLQSTTIKVRR